VDIYIWNCVEDYYQKKTRLEGLKAGIRKTDELMAPQMCGWT